MTRSGSSLATDHEAKRICLGMRLDWNGAIGEWPGNEARLE